MPSFDMVWIQCEGNHKYFQGSKCGHKLARMLEDGRYEVRYKGLAVYLCTGVLTITCAACETPTVLICQPE